MLQALHRARLGDLDVWCISVARQAEKGFCRLPTPVGLIYNLTRQYACARHKGACHTGCEGWYAVFTPYQAELMANQAWTERLERAERARDAAIALRRARVRSTLRRAIEAGLRYGIEAHEVEREFAVTLRRHAD